jgi:hypothetical protein
MDTNILTVCKETSKDSLPLMFGSDTWVRVLVKAVSSDALSYTWHEMTFCSRWDPHTCLVLCIGVNPTFQHLLQQTLSCLWSELLPSEPFSLHVPLVQAILELQDSSVWSIRDVVRNIEKASIVWRYTFIVLTLSVQGRSPLTLGFQDFTMMHEMARHAIHSSETLSMLIETVKAMQQQIIDLSTTHNRNGSGRVEASRQIRMNVDTQIRMLRGLLLRSQSNKERLQNEIALVRVHAFARQGARANILQAYNLIAQRDSQAMRDLGEASRLDSGALKTIALVTMAFLPPTFLSVRLPYRLQVYANTE